MIEMILIAYVFGILVTTMALVESADWNDFAASGTLAIFWPVVIPAAIVRRVLK